MLEKMKVELAVAMMVLMMASVLGGLLVDWKDHTKVQLKAKQLVERKVDWKDDLSAQETESTMEVETVAK